MADVIYRATDGLPAAKAAAAGLPPPPPEETLPDEAPPPDVVTKHLDGPELAIDDLGRATRKRREDHPESGHIQDLHSTEIVRMRYLDKQEKTLKQVAKDTSDYHALERADLLLGKSAALFDAPTKRDIGSLLNPNTVEPTKIGLRAGDFEPAELKDAQPITELDTIRNARDAAEFVGNWRDARAAEAEQ